MTLFPSTEGLAKGQNNEIILGGSIGLNKILLNLKEWANSPIHDIWDIYFINLYTVARNVWIKDIRLDQFMHGIDTDTDMIATYLEAYHTNSLGAKPPIIVFYVPTYEAIPLKYRRECVGNTLEFNNLYDKVRARYPVKFSNISRSMASTLFFFPCNRNLYPHKELVYAMEEKFFGDFTYRSPKVLLLSHCPIDLHLYKRIHNFSLIESYTGQIKKLKDFGTKLVKDVDVPFNTYTHRLFGDSIHLTPLVSGKQKTLALDVAQKYKWINLTDSEILSLMVHKVGVKEALLSELKF